MNISEPATAESLWEHRETLPVHGDVQKLSMNQSEPGQEQSGTSIEQDCQSNERPTLVYDREDSQADLDQWVDAIKAAAMTELEKGNRISL